MTTNSLLQDLRLLFAVYRGATIDYRRETSSSRVAVIMGAQVLEGGRPSRTLDARVRHAAHLHAEGALDLLIPTGGLGEHPPKEADLMTEMLLDKNVPRKAILPEDAALNTWDSAVRVVRVARENGIGRVRVVTDPLHCVRTVWAFEAVGISAQAEPAYASPMWRKTWLRRGQLVRETAALIWYRTRYGVGSR